MKRYVNSDEAMVVGLRRQLADAEAHRDLLAAKTIWATTEVERIAALLREFEGRLP